MLRYPKLIELMIARRDRAADRATKFGLPNIRSLIIVTRLPGEDKYLEIKPTPTINELGTDSQAIDGLNRVSGAVKTYEVKGISRSYTKEQLEHQAVDYIIDGKLKFGEIISGTLCRLTKITEQTLTWEMTLEERIGERNFY